MVTKSFSCVIQSIEKYVSLVGLVYNVFLEWVSGFTDLQPRS